jgi:hypothetical protein
MWERRRLKSKRCGRDRSGDYGVRLFDHALLRRHAVATIDTILFYPMHEILCRWFGGRRSLAAAASVTRFVLHRPRIVLGPLADEATRL